MTGSKTGARVILEGVRLSGVDCIFANPGTSELHLLNAVDDTPGITPVLCLFEGVATGAADGYARLAGRPAATLLHLGPGLANAAANLHNARRAGSPVISIVGDHARDHLQYDAPLTSDVDGAARPFSDAVARIDAPADIAAVTAQACRSARERGGQVSTLIVPADIAWCQTDQAAFGLAPNSPPPVPSDRVEALARALVATRRRAVIYAGGAALHGAGLDHLHRIAAATGADLLAPTSPARLDRGRGRPDIPKLEYLVEPAALRLARYDLMVLVGLRPPAAFFAHPTKPPTPLSPHTVVETLAFPGDDVVGALANLAAALAAPAAGLPLRDAPDAAALTPGTDAPLTADLVGRAVAALMPEGAVLCDEGISNSQTIFNTTVAAAPHSWIQITGGAIGNGPPLALGAALGDRSRRVVAVQADGSALYTLQALWTQARTRANVTTVILSNRRYAILRREMASLGLTMGPVSEQMSDLGDPAIDWVSLARGFGVEAATCSTLRALMDLLGSALRHEGPFLIEAQID